MVEDSYVKISKTGKIVSYVGKDATDYYLAMVLRDKLMCTVGIANHLAGDDYFKQLLDQATKISRKKYTADRKGNCDAFNDVQQWLQVMALALPIVKE